MALLDPTKERIDYRGDVAEDLGFALDQTLGYCKERGKRTPPEVLDASTKRTLANGLTRLTLTFRPG